jgi:hypothetical protein
MVFIMKERQVRIVASQRISGPAGKKGEDLSGFRQLLECPEGKESRTGFGRRDLILFEESMRACPVLDSVILLGGRLTIRFTARLEDLRDSWPVDPTSRQNR